MAPPKVVLLMADYGNDPTEAATPFAIFSEAGFEVSFATETGKVPRCDERMLSGVTQKLLGAAQPAIEQHEAMIKSEQINKPLSWTSPSFSLSAFDLVFLPGGHDKGMQQYIISESLHKHLAEYMPLTQRSNKQSPKICAAICHGVQVLAAANGKDGKSVIHDFETTSLTSFMEGMAFWGTRMFLGDYYKTFGYGTDDVEVAVRNRLDDPEKQYKTGGSMSTPFVHADPKYNYLSARYPPDADLLAKETVKLVQSLAL